MCSFTRIACYCFSLSLIVPSTRFIDEITRVKWNFEFSLAHKKLGIMFATRRLKFLTGSHLVELCNRISNQHSPKWRNITSNILTIIHVGCFRVHLKLPPPRRGMSRSLSTLPSRIATVRRMPSCSFWTKFDCVFYLLSCLSN